MNCDDNTFTYTTLHVLPGTEPTYRKYQVIQNAVDILTIKAKRRLFKIMRETSLVNAGTFFPTYGLTAGEFSTWYVLSGSQRRQFSQNSNNASTKQTYDVSQTAQ